jgi:hypothetical protein
MRKLVFKDIASYLPYDLAYAFKDYTYESKSILGHDEREPIEFVEIFLNKQELKRKQK